MTKRKPSPPGAHNLSPKATVRARAAGSVDALTESPAVDTGYIEIGRLVFGKPMTFTRATAGAEMKRLAGKPKRQARRKCR